MGLSDLEIYHNLEYSDFFYFTKPFLVNSRHSNQPISRFQVRFKLLLKIFQNSQEFLIQPIID